MGLGWSGSAMASGVNVYNASGSFKGGYSTIQAGVDACPVGGKVSVSAGNYNESVKQSKEVAKDVYSTKIDTI
ncbi:MAG: hypothetical protein V1749_03285 [Candidatus Desantisbacteria bacterium]